ncbi:MAG: phosphoglycerate kinase, partial [Melioribacteraceae bacterium]|nr:phosphoglycerate kinase [Melioribacteraceae bacterium]
GTAHRAHASTTVVAQFFHNHKCFGYLLAQEIESIKKVMETGEKQVLAILGGAKVSSKITIIENILDKIDHLIIGGGMTFTFIKAQGGSIGNSLVEDDKMELALEILELAKKKNVQIHLPTDVIAAKEFSNDSPFENVDVDRIPPNYMGLDIGTKTREIFKNIVLKSGTIVWNGPMGVFEFSNFAEGTNTIAEALAEATSNGAISIVGGGDSAAAIKNAGLEDKVSHISTGGGASLEFLEGKTLPGVAALNDE